MLRQKTTVYAPAKTTDKTLSMRNLKKISQIADCTNYNIKFRLNSIMTI